MSTRKNTFMMAAYEVLVYIAPLITAPYIARVLGTYGTGIYSYTYSIAAYFVILIQLGVNLYGRREIAGKLSIDERTESFWGIFGTLCISFLISTTLFLLLLRFCEDSVRVPLLWQFFVLIASFLDISWFFFGIEEFKYAISRNIIVKVLSVILVFLFIRSADDTLRYVALMSVTNLVSVLVMWIALPKYITKGRPSFKNILVHCKPLLILTVPVLSIQLYSITDKVFIGLLMDMDSVGIYENMYKLSRVPVALITTIGTVLLPRITNMIASGREKETYRYVEKSLSLTLMIASACGFGLIGIAPWLVRWYYGDSFISGTAVLQILSGILLVIAWGNVFRNQFIIPRNMDQIYLTSVVSAAGINIVLNFFFIPLWGMIGAAIASVISELVVCVYQSVKIRTWFNFRKLLLVNLQYPLCGAIMCAIVTLLGRAINSTTTWAILVMVLIGGLCFIGMVLISESLTKTDALKSELHRICIHFRG